MFECIIAWNYGVVNFAALLWKELCPSIDLSERSTHIGLYIGMCEKQYSKK